LVDIFLFGSALKSKEKPNDVDVITLFRNKKYEEIESINYRLKKIGTELNINLHIEPIIIDNLHKEKVYINLLHEGLSIKYMKSLSELLQCRSYILIIYSLKNKTASDKVRFSYALYGRKKGKGFLRKINGKEIGKGSIFVPIAKQELIRDFFKQWNVSFTEQRVSIFQK
jgi:hypothetical protein